MKRWIQSFLVVAVLTSGSGGVANYPRSVSESPGVVAAVAPAAYPPIAQQAGARGDVTVEVKLDAEGNVLSAKLISGHPLLRKVSEEAARQWKFSSISESTKERTVRLTFGYRQVDKGPNPINGLTTVFLPPYKVEVQSHPRIID